VGPAPSPGLLLAELHLGGPIDPWLELGFSGAASVQIGAVFLRFSGGEGGGLVGWRLEGPAGPAEVDGVPTAWADGDNLTLGRRHPNGATHIDHVVLATPDLARTEAALAALGLERRRRREAGDLLQAFYRLEPVVLEVVARAGEAGDGPASLWGFTVVVEDLDALAARLGDRLGRVKEADQPGRRIATVRREAGLGVPLAFMSA
jgi:hypothetical protein